MRSINRILLSIALLTTFTGCNNQPGSDAQKTARDIQSAVKANTPGSEPTSVDGYTMKALVDGKAWTAAYMMPDRDARSSYKTIHGEYGETYMNFMLYRNAIAVGKSYPFGENSMANLSVEGVDGFWSGRSGQVTITTMDDQWIDGTFEFDASSQSSGSDKIIHVTNGHFRVPAR